MGNEYITDEIEMPNEPTWNATSIGEYSTDNKQIVTVVYDDGYSCMEHILYDAKPSCKHKIQPQWSGIKCIKCGGWYCA